MEPVAAAGGGGTGSTPGHALAARLPGPTGALVGFGHNLCGQLGLGRHTGNGSLGRELLPRTVWRGAGAALQRVQCGWARTLLTVDGLGRGALPADNSAAANTTTSSAAATRTTLLQLGERNAAVDWAAAAQQGREPGVLQCLATTDAGAVLWDAAAGRWAWVEAVTIASLDPAAGDGVSSTSSSGDRGPGLAVKTTALHEPAQPVASTGRCLDATPAMAVCSAGRECTVFPEPDRVFGSANNSPARDQRAKHPTAAPCPVVFQFAHPVVSVACGKSHALLLTADGTALSLGLSTHGQLGHGTAHTKLAPEPIEAMLGLRMTGVVCGGWHSALLAESGDLYSFGWNQEGQLGRNTEREGEPDWASAFLPGLVAFADEDLRLSMVACGSKHTLAVATNGQVFAWGWGAYGQLGLGEPCASVSIPTQITALEGKHAKAVYSGPSSWHSLVLLEEPPVPS